MAGAAAARAATRPTAEKLFSLSQCPAAPAQDLDPSLCAEADAEHGDAMSGANVHLFEDPKGGRERLDEHRHVVGDAVGRIDGQHAGVASCSRLSSTDARRTGSSRSAR